MKRSLKFISFSHNILCHICIKPLYIQLWNSTFIRSIRFNLNMTVSYILILSFFTLPNPTGLTTPTEELPGALHICEAGSYLSPTDGRCVVCEENTYSPAGAYQCNPCPDSMFSAQGSTSLEDCFLKTGKMIYILLTSNQIYLVVSTGAILLIHFLSNIGQMPKQGGYSPSWTKCPCHPDPFQ